MAEAKVFLDYTQAALDDAFEQNIWAPNVGEVRARNKARCAAVRERVRPIERAYGPGPDETLEILPTARKGAPVVLFIHGGRWLPQPDNGFVYAAGTIVDAGAHFVAARFATLENPPGKTRLPAMIAQLRRAVAWLYRNAQSFGGDPERLHIIGHSSGGHLTGVLLTTDWAAQGLPQGVLKSGICVSGMYELEPVLLSVRGAYVKLSATEAAELSAERHPDRLCCPALIAYGTKESPEFQRQARSFAATLQAAGKPATLLALPGCNHFEGIASLAEPDSVLARAALALFGLTEERGKI